jgi:hypothetical protein
MNKSILCLGFSLYAVLGCAQNEQKLVFDFASPRQTKGKSLEELEKELIK